jgi:hypothetical protein
VGQQAAGALNSKQIPSSDQQTLLAAAGPFRAGSAPNTVGLFLDESPMSEILHDPQNAISILYAGTHL